MDYSNSELGQTIEAPNFLLCCHATICSGDQCLLFFSSLQLCAEVRFKCIDVLQQESIILFLQLKNYTISIK